MAKVEEVWASLPSKGKWDVQVALRGPDCRKSDGLKWFTTSVIRGHMRDVIRVGGLVNDSLKAIIIPHNYTAFDPDKGKKEKGIFAWDYHHFFSHVIEAARWLGIPIISCDGEIYLKAVSSPMGVDKIAIELAEGVEDEKGKKLLLSHAEKLKGGGW